MHIIGAIALHNLSSIPDNFMPEGLTECAFEVKSVRILLLKEMKHFRFIENFFLVLNKVAIAFQNAKQFLSSSGSFPPEWLIISLRSIEQMRASVRLASVQVPEEVIPRG